MTGFFVDWGKTSPCTSEEHSALNQILLMKALETMAVCAKLLDIKTDYRIKCSEELRNKIKQTFWSYRQKAYLHAIEDGKSDPTSPKFPNIFAILYGSGPYQEDPGDYEERYTEPCPAVLHTPYMRFYELEALCMMGYHTKVLQEIRDYWAACCVREPPRSGKNMCLRKTAFNTGNVRTPLQHEIALPCLGSLARLSAGQVLPRCPACKPGYQEFEVRPVLGDLEWMEGSVPTPYGMIQSR